MFNGQALLSVLEEEYKLLTLNLKTNFDIMGDNHNKNKEWMWPETDRLLLEKRYHDLRVIKHFQKVRLDEGYQLGICFFLQLLLDPMDNDLF